MKFTYLCTIKNVQIKSHNEETNLTEYVIIQRNVDIAGFFFYIFFKKEKIQFHGIYMFFITYSHLERYTTTAEILSIRRNTLSNQSINRSINRSIKQQSNDL